MTRFKTVFLIDDDVDDRDIFALALTEIDDSIACVTASDGIDALSRLRDRSFTPDYIFLDLNMPRMNGKQCLSAMKGEPRLQHVPIIIYTTSSEHQDITETLELGASDFLTKPTRISELTERLRFVLTKYGYTNKDAVSPS
ncbi:MAG TPA: response regulator [Chryseosolibacter sp.]|nr:response regulator [Chryseosolibacter sp.]